MSVRCSRARNSEDGKSNSIGCFCCSLQALDAFAAHIAEARIAEPRAFGLGSRQRLLGANRDHRPLLLGERGIDVARGSTIRCLGIEVVAASSNSSRQTLARNG
jgi:hypothetical protein